MRLAIVASHPVQYYAPLFRCLAARLNLTVFYAHRATPIDHAGAGFGVAFDWDIDLLSGYRYYFLENVAESPGLDHFAGVDTPEIAKRLHSGRFDAVLLMGWHLKAFHQALWASKWLRIPVLVRGDSQLNTPRAAWKRWAKTITYPSFLRCFDAALVVGKRNRDYWLHYGYPSARIFSSCHCVDNNWFSARASQSSRVSLRTRLGIARDTKVVLFAGKLVPFKRPLDLVAAAARVRSEGMAVEILVAGTGVLQADMQRLASDLSIPLHMLGFRNQTEMPAAYAAADLLALPSDGHETWGLVVNEALACHRPVVISDAIGCAPDMVEYIGDRAIFRMGDICAFTTSLRDVILNPLSRRKLAEIAEEFSLDSACMGIDRALRAACAKRS